MLNFAVEDKVEQWGEARETGEPFDCTTYFIEATNDTGRGLRKPYIFADLYETVDEVGRIDYEKDLHAPEDAVREMERFKSAGFEYVAELEYCDEI